MPARGCLGPCPCPRGLPVCLRSSCRIFRVSPSAALRRAMRTATRPSGAVGAGTFPTRPCQHPQPQTALLSSQRCPLPGLPCFCTAVFPRASGGGWGLKAPAGRRYTEGVTDVSLPWGPRRASPRLADLAAGSGLLTASADDPAEMKGNVHNAHDDRQRSHPTRENAAPGKSRAGVPRDLAAEPDGREIARPPQPTRPPGAVPAAVRLSGHQRAVLPAPRSAHACTRVRSRSGAWGRGGTADSVRSRLRTNPEPRVGGGGGAPPRDSARPRGGQRAEGGSAVGTVRGHPGALRGDAGSERCS